MPAEQGVWLDDEQCLLPRLNQPSQQNEKHAIGPGEHWPFHLPPENDELLAQERIFRHKLRVTSAKIGECSKWQ
jgi:hypothetical protein